MKNSSCTTVRDNKIDDLLYAKQDSMWLTCMPLCQILLYFQGCFVVKSKYNQSRYESLSAVPCM